MSSQKSILVAGSTGNQGGGVVRHCLAQGFRVIALVRDTTSSAALHLAGLGAELAQGTFDDRESLRRAMQDVDTVFFLEVKTADPKADLHRAKNLIEVASASANVTMMIVSTASKTGQHETFPRWGPDHPMYGYWLQKQAIEDLVRDAGFRHWTIIRPAHFLQNLLPPVNAILFPDLAKDLTIRTLLKPETKIPWLDVSDVGIVAAAAMQAPVEFTGREIELASEALTIEELAGKLSEAFGSEVKVEFYTGKDIAGNVHPVAVPSQTWANEVPDHDAAKAAMEFAMTPVDDFLLKHKAAILQKP
jgi:uncharacterized protein YbjT (DUF2867 family)